MMLKKVVMLLAVGFIALNVFADYAADMKAAGKLRRGRKYQEAMDAFVKLSQTEIDDKQKTAALEQAVDCALRQKKNAEALKLAKQIPLEPNSKKTQMEILGRRNKYKDIIAQFKDEDITAWPKNLVAPTLYIRGSAYLSAKNIEMAKKDIEKALEYPANNKVKAYLFLKAGDIEAMAGNNEAAIKHYRGVYSLGKNVRTHFKMRSVLAAVSVLNKEKKYEESLNEFKRINFDRLSGYWKIKIFMAYGKTLADSGKKSEAVEKYKEAMDVIGIRDKDKAKCEKAIKSLQQ
jgi:tetratricopeptide (TPR) repeat protein